MGLCNLSAIFLVAGLILISGCIQSNMPRGDNSTSPGHYQYIPPVKNVGLEKQRFNASGETFEIAVPGDWEDADNGDGPHNVISLDRPDGVCSFRLDIVNESIDEYESVIISSIVSEGGMVLQKHPLNYRTMPDGNFFFTETKGIECGGRTYYAFYSCLEDRYDMKRVKDIFDTMLCRETTE